MDEQNGSRPTKAELAYGLVREQILRGDLAPGAVIQQAFARPRARDQHDSPARGAAPADERRTGRAGRASRRPGHRADAEEARDLVEIRRSLDPLAAGLAAERRTRADLEPIRSTAAELLPLRTDPSAEELGHAPPVPRRDLLGFAQRSAGPDPRRTVGQGRPLPPAGAEDGRTRRISTAPTPSTVALVEAIAAGDAETAAAVMLAHVDASLGRQGGHVACSRSTGVVHPSGT